MGKPKSTKLRAFKVTVNNINEKPDQIVSILSNKLEHTHLQDRRMLINENDQEEDLICDFNISERSVFGGMLRIRPSEGSVKIPDEMFKKTRIHISNLESTDVESSVIYKDHYYFFLEGEYLITNLKSTTTIARLQTYINYLIEKERKDKFFEFTPMVKYVDGLKVTDLRRIKIIDPVSVGVNEGGNENTKQDTNTVLTKRFAINILNKVISDSISLDEVMLSEVISAEVLLKFRKPRTMSKEDYEREMGAFLKPISDLDNVTFYPKKGAPIKAEEVQVIKEVSIDTTSTNMISEKHLQQEMEKFLSEIKSENIE